MKKNFFKRGMAGLLSLVMCLTALVGIGTTTAYAAGERAEVYLVSFPRSGDANIDYSGTWGHPNLRYMNGWHSGESKYTTIRAMHSYDGNICYCIEPGVQQDTGDTYASKDETFWDNLPSDINSTISPYDISYSSGVLCNTVTRDPSAPRGVHRTLLMPQRWRKLWQHRFSFGKPLSVSVTRTSIM